MVWDKAGERWCRATVRPSPEPTSPVSSGKKSSNGISAHVASADWQRSSTAAQPELLPVAGSGSG